MKPLRKPPFAPRVNWNSPYADGLVALYAMNEAAGGVTRDAAGKCAPAVLTNGASWRSIHNYGPRIDLAYTGSRYLSIPYSSSSRLHHAGDLTVIVGFHYTTQNARCPLVTKIDNGSFGYYLDITNTPSLRMMCNSTSVANPGAVASVNPALNTFHVAAGTVKGTTARVYLGGVEQANGACEQVPNIAEAVAIGGRPGYDSTTLDGSVYWCAFYNKAAPNAVAALNRIDSVLDLIEPPPDWLYTGMGSGSWTPLEVAG